MDKNELQWVKYALKSLSQRSYVLTTPQESDITNALRAQMSCLRRGGGGQNWLYWLFSLGGHLLGTSLDQEYSGQEHLSSCTEPQSTQSAGQLSACSISIFLLASLVAGRRPQCRVAGNVLHNTHPLEYKICSRRPMQKSCWASSLRI
jgi:hypothetical protein